MSAALALPELPEQKAEVRPVHSVINDAVLYGTVAVLLFSPLAFGAVEPWAVFFLESAAAILFALWIVGQVRSSHPKILWAPTFSPMLAFGGVIFLQLALGTSAYRNATSGALLLYVAYALVSFLIAQTLTRTRQLRLIAHRRHIHRRHRRHEELHADLGVVDRLAARVFDRGLQLVLSRLWRIRHRLERNLRSRGCCGGSGRRRGAR